MFLSIMAAAYCEETLEGGDSRVVLRLPAALAPVKVAVMPLVRKDGLPERHVKLSTICVSISNVNTTKRILSGNVIAVKMPSAHRSV